MSIKRLFLPFLALLLGTVLLSWWLLVSSAAAQTAWQNKVDAALLGSTTGEISEEPLEFLVEIGSKADLRGIEPRLSKSEKGAQVWQRVSQAAAASQRPLVELLEAEGVPFRAYRVVNAIWVRGPRALIARLAGRPDVRYIHANTLLKLDEPAPSQPADLSDEAAALAAEWGINQINAPALWSQGITGTGAVIAGQDTGYQWDHPALKAQYRGWDGVSVDHNFQWHDAITTELSSNGTNPCGYALSAPCDDNGHGTHTMGTMAGGIGGNGNAIGVAPGAKWISCRNMEEGYGTLNTYIDCFDWFLAPTDLTGANPTPALAPDVINNSWSCPPSEGCNSGNFDLMQQAVETLRAAGVVVVVSAGNSGPACSTVNTPAAIFDASFTVGASIPGDGIAGFSSRGPVTVDGSGRLKPDVVAPGTLVYSSYKNSSYTTLQGTSMAGPHVAGAVALLISAVPEAAGQVDLLEGVLRESAVKLTTNETCGGDTPSSLPNHTFGYGRIDVAAAYQLLLAHLEAGLELAKSGPLNIWITSTAPTVTVPLTYTLAVTHSHPVSAAVDVVLTDTLPMGTVFVTATLPHVSDGAVITWSWPSLMNETRTVSLTVAAEMISPTRSLTVTNADYGVISSGGDRLSGPPVTTVVTILKFNQFFPLIQTYEKSN